MSGPAPVRQLPAPSADRVRTILDAFSRASLLVVGDLMLDQFIVGSVRRISPEAPVPVVEFGRNEYRVGGAANVAHNVRALGATVDLIGVVGSDASAERLRESLSSLGIGMSGIVTDARRPTTTKTRIVTDRHQQVARVDYESDADVADEVEQSLMDAAGRMTEGARAVVVSDYLKGCVTTSLMSRLVHVSRERRVPVLVDPKIAHIDRYRHTRLVTPNHHEAEIATNRRIRTDEEACAAAHAFCDRAGCESVLITRGEHGMWLLDGDSEGSLPAVAREVADVTGAGDTVIATLALAVACGASIVEAATLANFAAGIVVGKFGPSTVSRDELAKAMGV
jgi:D-beta-D-heptose 7-phosphate kinase/D-beta-D-heptose 1-phosphate adenosyltransferase